MLVELLRLLAEIGPGVIWVFIFTAVIVTVFVAFVGIALWATMRAKDPVRRPPVAHTTCKGDEGLVRAYL